MVEIDTPHQDRQQANEGHHAEESGDTAGHIGRLSNRCALRIARHESDRNS